MNKKEKPLHYLFYYIPVCLLTLSGLSTSLYLSVSHYRVYTDITYSSFCAISKAINCDTVSQSPYSILWGVPLPVWGITGYVFLAILLPFSYNTNDGRKAIWSLFFWISISYSIYSIYLAGISTFYIHSYCLMCILTYGINFALVFYSWLIIKRFNKDGVLKGLISNLCFVINNKKFVIAVIVFTVSAGWMLRSFDDYWNLKIESPSDELPNGMTEDGHPWIGAENPELVIIEYTDYMCFQCKKMHFFLRDMIAKNQGKIRLVHKHFPLDKKYNTYINEDLHVGSGKMASLAVYAALKGHFWRMNDLLFNADRSKNSIDLTEIAEKSGIDIRELNWALNSKDIRLLLKRDIAYGIKAGVSGTPSYEIDGKTYEGTIPSEIIKKYVIEKK